MRTLSQLFDNNRLWAERMRQRDPSFFETLTHQQAPAFLWIGCSDSRVPANEIVGLLPGEMFVHRNVGNVVVHSDLNCLSVMQYAVDVLCVRHLIVCGHYDCGGIEAAEADRQLGLIDNWLRHVQDVARKHDSVLSKAPNSTARLDRLCELNVIEQVANVCATTIVRSAWQRNQALSVHGWIYRVSDGILRDLGLCVESEAELTSGYAAAVARHVSG
jgi:carbonic anhydrase